MTFVGSAKSSPRDFPLPAGKRAWVDSRVIGDDTALPGERRGQEFSLTLKPYPGEGLIDIFSRLARAVERLEATVLKMIVFGSVEAHRFGLAAIKHSFHKLDWPITWVEGSACDDHPIAGIQVFALHGHEVRRIVRNDRVVGSVFESAGSRHCLLGGLVPTRLDATQADQTQEMFDEMQAALALAGFSLGDVVRTWFYLDDLLSWYGTFNRVRTRLYSATKFRHQSLPASTGVAGRNPVGAELIAAAWAVQFLGNGSRAREVLSPLQCPAPAYGSSFSRAMELSSASGRRLLISGTASIAPGGLTTAEGNAARQIEVSMDVVQAILHSRRFQLSDITRATAYFKSRADVKLFNQWCAENGLTSLPVLTVECDICREDLLFELEADAWVSVPSLT